MPDDRPDMDTLLPSVYDLTAWLREQQEAPGTPDHVRRSLVIVTAHIAGHYWAQWNREEL